MKIQSNERGGALLMVLLLVAVFTILGVGLLSINISASKQFDKKEEQVRARHLAEMGIIHYQTKISEEVKEFNKDEPEIYYRGTGKERVVDEEKTRRKHTKKLCEKIKEVGNFNSEGTLTTGDYEVEIESIDCMNITSETTEISVELISKGIVSSAGSGIGMKEISAEVFILAEESEPGGNPNNGGGNIPPESPDNKVRYVDEELYIDKEDPMHESNSLHINGNLRVHPGNNNTNITVEKDLYIQGNIDINNHACITVYGDFTLIGKIDKINANFYIVIYGDAYFENPPSEEDIKNKAGIFVIGNVNNSNADHIYTKRPPKGSGCEVGEIDIPTYDPYSKFKWDVEPNLNAEYL